MSEKEDYKELIKPGDRIYCKNTKDLRATMLSLCSLGYGVGILSFDDFESHVLTVLEMPKVEKAVQ